MREGEDAKLELDWAFARVPGEEERRTKRDAQGAEAAPASEEEEWFSAEELVRSSEVEIGADRPEAGGLLPGMDPRAASSWLAALERPFANALPGCSTEARAALGGLTPGRILQVGADSPQLAADFIEGLAEALAVEAEADYSCLVVSSRPAAERSANFAARRAGLPRRDLWGPSAPDWPSLDADMERLRTRWRALALDEGPEPVSPVIAVGEALRAWKRRTAQAVGPCAVVAVPWPAEVFDAHALAGLRRSIVDHDAVLLWAAAPASSMAADPRDAWLHLAAEGDGEALRVQIEDPRWGMQHRGEGRWQRATGRVSI